MLQRVDEITNLQIAAKDFAAVAADLSIAPNAGIVRHDAVTQLLPKMAVIAAGRMHPDMADRKAQVGQNRVPQFDRAPVIIAAKREISDHFEMGQMQAVADEINIIRTDAGLQRAVTTTIGCSETLPNPLHTAANEQRRVVVFRYDRAVDDERKTKLLEAAQDYIKQAERRIISLSSLERFGIDCWSVEV